MNRDLQTMSCGPERVCMVRSPAMRCRRGFVLVLFVLLTLALLVLVAMAMDLAYAMEVRAEAQTSADAAALAGAWGLIHPDRLKPEPDATQAIINARTDAVAYAAKNEVAMVFPLVDRNDANAIDGEVVIGHLPSWSYPPVYPWNTASPNYLWQFDNPNKYNCVTVRVQRTEARNGPVPLYFGRVLGMPSMNIHVAATAIIEWGRPIGFRPTAESGPTSLMPFAMSADEYHRALDGDQSLPDQYTYDDSVEPAGPGRVSTGPDGSREVILYPALGPGGWETGQGNFGTIDLGGNDNSEAVLVRQILEGVSEADISLLPGGELTIPGDYRGDTGLSAGMKDELASIIGVPRTILLYQTVLDPGNNAIFTIVEAVGIVILEVDFQGNPKLMRVQPATVVDDSVIIGDPPPGEDDWFPTVVKPPRLIH